ncbi:MAG: electron transport complex protein RnfC, partial [Nitrospinota bacterium]|nr:electron transport complex protein RnfC [Nitrospinota bacterium]
DQHVGAPAEPMVQQGQKVARGQMIGAIPEGKLGAAYHASIEVRVSQVTEQSITIER